MNAAPQISIIVPVHNTAEYLRKCVDSIRNQTLDNIEIILVDNLSDDGSAAICDEYSQLDSRIKVLHLSRAGLSIARNAGLEVASAPYIGFVDSDDHVAPAMYQELFEELIGANAEIAYCNFCYEYEDGHIEWPFQSSKNVYLRSPKEVMCEIMWDTISSSVCTKLFKKELFASLRFPEGVFFEDHITTFKWVSMCDRVVWVDRNFYFYYQRQTSICHTLNPIKHYHYFLAEYSRLTFIKEQSLFSENELLDVNSMIVRNCLMHFKEVLLEVKPKFLREPINEMRSKIKSLTVLSRDEVDYVCYKRIRKISYFWPIYYFVHFSFKKRDWKP